MWNPKIIDTDKVLYVAIADAIERDIKLGVLNAYDKMPPQRALAKIIGVNLTTISRAYSEAQRRGLISGSVGSGTFVLNQEEASLLTPSAYQKDDSIIDLGLVGSIYIEGYEPSEILKAIAADACFHELLDYVPSQGLLRHREVAARWMTQYGVTMDVDNTIVCSGAIHAINCCLLSCFEPDSRIAVDSLTFAGFKNIAKHNQMKLEAIAMDDEGMIPESLEEACKKHAIKGLYLMPNMQNPTATTMTSLRKEAIAKVILKYNLILIEDDIYNFTNLKDRKALSALVPENGIFICGMSKTFFPGLRIAFAKVPQKYMDKFIQTITNTVWMAPPLNAEIVTRMIDSKVAEEIAEKKRRLIAHRLKMAKEILKDFEVKAADNSVYLWLKLPEGWSNAAFESAAFIQGVRVISAYKFYVGNEQAPNAIRISLGSVHSDEQLLKGLNIIAQLLRKDHFLSESIM